MIDDGAAAFENWPHLRDAGIGCETLLWPISGTAEVERGGSRFAAAVSREGLVLTRRPSGGPSRRRPALIRGRATCGGWSSSGATRLRKSARPEAVPSERTAGSAAAAGRSAAPAAGDQSALSATAVIRPQSQVIL